MPDEVTPDVQESPNQVVGPSKPRLWQVLGPGLITGAADDDPSGIATYSQAGAQFGFQLAWTLLLTYPLMVVIQAISRRDVTWRRCQFPLDQSSQSLGVVRGVERDLFGTRHDAFDGYR